MTETKPLSCSVYINGERASDQEKAIELFKQACKKVMPAPDGVGDDKLSANELLGWDGIVEIVARALSPRAWHRHSVMSGADERTIFNTVYQMQADRRSIDASLNRARKILTDASVRDLLAKALKMETALRQIDALDTYDVNGRGAFSKIAREALGEEA